MQLIVTGYHLLGPSDPEYKEMKDYLLWSGHHHFNVWAEHGERKLPLGTHTYELDEKHLFDDQVNTTCGKRVHDWADYMPYVSYTKPRWGHYIENLDELNDLRRTYFKCGYCGHTDKVGGWCEKCRGSQYLTPDHFHLLKMRQLTTKPKKHEVPKLVLKDIEEQQAATATRLAEKDLADTFKQLEQKKRNAEIEIEFRRYCISKGLNNVTLQNLIYYPHTKTFNFGWRNTLNAAQITDIKSRLGDTPDWKVDFKS